MGCAEIDKGFATDLAKNKDLDTYVVFDDSENIEYLNLNGDIIGMETKSTIKTRKTVINQQHKTHTKSQKVNKSY